MAVRTAPSQRAGRTSRRPRHCPGVWRADGGLEGSQNIVCIRCRLVVAGQALSVGRGHESIELRLTRNKLYDLHPLYLPEKSVLFDLVEMTDGHRYFMALVRATLAKKAPRDWHADARASGCFQSPNEGPAWNGLGKGQREDQAKAPTPASTLSRTTLSRPRGGVQKRCGPPPRSPLRETGFHAPRPCRLIGRI
jgi:hypothetical protein